MTSNSQTNCLVRQSACGLQAGQTECSKCGIRTDVRYVSQEDLDMAVAKGTALYWQNHAQSLEEKYNKPAPPTKPASSSTPVQSRATGQVFQDLPTAPQMVVLPSGKFLMGSPLDEPLRIDIESPQHEVTIDYRLAMGKYPVTFEEWDACVADGGTKHKPKDMGGFWSRGRGKRPVIHVNWNDAEQYVVWLNKKVGIAEVDPTRYRLPSEAEWEYACRAGTTGMFGLPTGLLLENQANYDASETFAGAPIAGRKSDNTTPVGVYWPNQFGLYDMHGNVFEWCQDHSHENYDSAPTNGTAWEGSGNTARRVIRGGSWHSHPLMLRSAFRAAFSPDHRSNNFGFRIARTLP